MPKKTQTPHVYRVGQRAALNVTLAGKVQSIEQQGNFVVVTKFFPLKGVNLKNRATKMVAARQGGSGPITGPIASPDACGGYCQDSITWGKRTLNYHHCEVTTSADGVTATCHYRPA
jgi:hypothetical protein